MLKKFLNLSMLNSFLNNFYFTNYTNNSSSVDVLVSINSNNNGPSIYISDKNFNFNFCNSSRLPYKSSEDNFISDIRIYIDKKNAIFNNRNKHRNKNNCNSSNQKWIF